MMDLATGSTAHELGVGGRSSAPGSGYTQDQGPLPSFAQTLGRGVDTCGQGARPMALRPKPPNLLNARRPYQMQPKTLKPLQDQLEIGGGVYLGQRRRTKPVTWRDEPC